MSLTPIKLLKDTLYRNTLLNLKGETDEIDGDDYLESRITTNKRAKTLLAIEDASEMAKLYLHRNGIFELIARDIQRESRVDFNFHCSNTKELQFKNTKRIEFVLMEAIYGDNTGHYGMACVDHKRRMCIFYDSMVKDVSDFEIPLKNALPTEYTVSMSCDSPQPTGGFVADSFESFKHPSYSAGIPKRLLESAYEVSQYDELSQHHFCYIESFLAMMTSLGLSEKGSQDPRERLKFVKRFVWGVIHKYTPKVCRNTAQWKYFKENFSYMLETFAPNGKRMSMVLEYIQVPPTKGEVVFKVKKNSLRRDIDHRWTLQRIAKWSHL
tara:strand:+ start:1480 stop:2454 length:975 start_codon:yes stop_codon:yes gene_type:complete